MRGSLSKLMTILIPLLSLRTMAVDLPKGLDILGGAKSSPGTRVPKEVARWSGLSSWATSVAFSADDKTLAIGLKDQIELVDTSSKAVLHTIRVKLGQVRSLNYSPDGKLLAAGGYQNVVLVDTNTREIVRELKGHRAYVTAVAFSPDGRRIATACDDEVGRVWNVVGDQSPIEFKGHRDPVTGIAWSPDGTLVATAAGDDTRPTKAGQVRIWDSASGVMRQQFELHQKAATGVVFSTDGRFVLSSSVDEHVNVYDLANEKPLGFFAGHSRPTNAVAVHPDGETAISISGGRAVGKNELIAWEIETGEVMSGIEAHDAKVTALAVSHDGRFVATASQDKSVAIWNFAFLAIGLPEVAASDSTATADATITAQVADANQAVAKPQADAPSPPKALRAGIIGLDTSHAIAFTKTLNAEKPVPAAEGCRIIAAYPKGSPDIPSSVERVPGYIAEVKLKGVEIVDSIEELLQKVDVIFLETNDGRPHFEQLLPCLKAGKPVFIDKPIAGTLADAIAIFEAAKLTGVPVFSSSSLRFGKNTVAIRGGSLGKVTYCETTSPANMEPSHPDLFWYGIHGTESLFTVMGTGCQSVVRSLNAEGKIEVKGQWPDGRIGVYREGSGYQGKAIGEKGESAAGAYDGYDPLLFEIVKFFRTGIAPVSQEETLEIYAFMEAADESKRQNGASVTLESVMAKARAEAAKKLAQIKLK